jgi:hypothetical protein
MEHEVVYINMRDSAGHDIWEAKFNLHEIVVYLKKMVTWTTPWLKVIYKVDISNI